MKLKLKFFVTSKYNICVKQKVETAPKSKKKIFFDKLTFSLYVILLVFAVCFSSFIWYQKTYFVAYWVNGQSMWPTLNAETKTKNGEFFNENVKSMGDATGVDYVIGDNHQRILDNIKRFDIIVCKYNDADVYDKIKRVIVLPGETFYIESAAVGSENNGRLFILNDATGEFEYVAQPSEIVNVTKGIYPATYFNEPVTLAEDEYFVMGDNRAHSSDSRQNGPVKKINIESKIVAVVAKCKTIYTINENNERVLTPTEINYCWPRFL